MDKQLYHIRLWGLITHSYQDNSALSRGMDEKLYRIEKYGMWLPTHGILLDKLYILKEYPEYFQFIYWSTPRWQACQYLPAAKGSRGPLTDLSIRLHLPWLTAHGREVQISDRVNTKIKDPRIACFSWLSARDTTCLCVIWKTLEQ